LKFETAPDPLPDYPKSFIGNSDHIALSLEAAEKSMVLIQNNQAILPLDKSEVKNVLVLGELAINENIGDHGSSQVRPAYVVTPMQGLEKMYGENVSFSHDTGEDLEKAKQLAKEADAVIFVVGYNHDDEGEFIEMGGTVVGGDRKSIRLHEHESRLLQEIGPLNNQSVSCTYWWKCHHCGRVERQNQ
jgi:beta-glucosidase